MAVEKLYHRAFEEVLRLFKIRDAKFRVGAPLMDALPSWKSPRGRTRPVGAHKGRPYPYSRFRKDDGNLRLAPWWVEDFTANCVSPIESSHPTTTRRPAL